MARRIGSQSREAERRIMEALQARLSARMERAMMANIGKAYHEAADQVAHYQPVNVSDTSTGRILLAGWDTAASVFGDRLLDQIGKRHGRRETKASSLFKLAFSEFSRRWIATKVTQIDDTTEKDIRDIVVAGVAEGLSVEGISKLIRTHALPASKLRGHVIARTETHFASSWANQTAADESGIELVKEWCAAGGSRTRESHRQADGQRQPLKRAFDVEGYSLMYPGDASGPAELVVNCRCQSLYVEP